MTQVGFTQMQERKLDLFKLLDAISKKNKTYYRELSPEEQKEVAPLVIMRWLSGTKDPTQVFFLNQVVNPFVFDLSKHKELLYMLMTVCTDGKFKRYTWQKAKGKLIPAMPVSTGVLKQYYNYSTKEALDVLPIMGESDIIALAELQSYEKDEISKIKAEFKKLK